MDLREQTIVVTGCSSGIGAETARLLHFYGARVIGVDRNDPPLTLDAFVRADLATARGIDAAVAELPARIDHLCNVAGVPGTVPVEQVARVNYLGLRHLTLRLLERLRPGGSIVNVSSILGAEWRARLAQHKALAETADFEAGLAWLAKHPVPSETCYQYFKEALIVWTLVRSHKWFLERSVRVNCVSPGPVLTPILGDFADMLGQERVQRDAKLMKRPALADEIAPVIAFLCSEQARWVSGANVPVDAGLACAHL